MLRQSRPRTYDVTVRIVFADADAGYGLSAPTTHMAKNWEPPP